MSPEIGVNLRGSRWLKVRKLTLNDHDNCNEFILKYKNIELLNDPKKEEKLAC